ncbi:MAG: helix-turn-helix domain-containing protein, partial [Candidatus Zixiibacteriota bacterium]
RSVNEERIKFVIRASQGAVNLSSLCREFGISRPTGYLWLDRYREAGSKGGIPVMPPLSVISRFEELSGALQALSLRF